MAGYAFLPEALEANAAGRLTDAQRDMFREGPWVRRLIPALTGDLRRHEVHAVDGPIRKTFSEPGGAGQHMKNYFLEVAGTTYGVPSPSVWESAPSAGYVRLYYLPRSRTAVNLERLPDPPVEATRETVAGAVANTVAAAFRPAFTKRGRAEKAELLAQASAVLNAATGTSAVPESGAPAPDPVTAADLVGRWTSPLFDVDVRSDGTLSLGAALEGVGRHAQWHIAADGRLHVRFDGDAEEDELVTAIARHEDRLDLDIGGQHVTLQRSGR